MKRNLSYLLLSVAAVLGAASVHAQEADTIPSGRTCQSCVKFDYSVKFKSRHVWNGHQSCNAWNFQPNLNISFKGLYFNVWAYTPVAPLMTRKRMLPDEVGGPSPLNTEIDFTLGFAYGPFAVEYYDFFYIDEQTRFNYLFRWREADKGNLHQQWAQVWFNGVKQFPVSITAGIFTFGDYIVQDGQLKEWHSMYIGLGYTHTLPTGQTLHYELGGTPYKGCLANQANIGNVKFAISQPVPITDRFGLNLGGELIFNPARENVYFIFSLGLL